MSADDATAAAGAREAAPSSALAAIRKQREEKLEKLWIDLPVPRYEDPELFVRYKPVDDGRATRINKEFDKSKDPERQVVANAKLLAECCLGVFTDPESDPETWPRFDDDLADALGLPTGVSAVAVVRGLFFTDGDVNRTSQTLQQWSGYSLEVVEERAAGN